MKIVASVLLLFNVAWGQKVETFQGGTANTTTDRFQVEGPWKLSWDFEGTALKVYIHSDTGGATAKPVSQAGSGKGSLSVERGGTFWLEIKSVGNYALRVEETSRLSELPVFEGGMERKGSATFTAPEGWSFRYSAEGGVFKATLFDANRRQIGEPVVLIGGGSAEKKVGKAGQYFFMIQSAGTYKIEVLKP